MSYGCLTTARGQPFLRPSPTDSRLWRGPHRDTLSLTLSLLRNQPFPRTYSAQIDFACIGLVYQQGKSAGSCFFSCLPYGKTAFCSSVFLLCFLPWFVVLVYIWWFVDLAALR
ncbi:hypothetical protein BDW68DRAFT_96717 [Aspergillus falconensis]